MCLVALLGCDAAPPPRPNVIVVTIDTTRADAIGAYGQVRPTSPRIDALAAGGVLFEDAVTSAPSTLPSHATIFTAKQPFAHGVRSNAGFRLASEHETLAEVLAAAGYATHAEIAAPVLGAEKQLDQGFSVYRDPSAVRDPLEALDRESRYRRLTRDAEDITDHALAFVREPRSQPFFLWLHYFDPHKPYAPPEDLAGELAPYHAEIRRVDRELGRLLDELDALGLAERTLVVVTSDHGEGQGQHGEATHSYFVYESTMRVPLIFAGAGVPVGVRARSLARTVDVMPTVLELLGLPPLAGVQGVSLVPMFHAPDHNPNLIGYGESIEGTLAFGSSVLRFVRVGRWKYIHKELPELYDVRADPTEVRNEFPTRQRIATRLRSRLAEVVEVGAGSGEDARVALDPEQIEELRALGYIAGDPDEADGATLDSLELVGPDPSEWIFDVELFASGWGWLQDERWDAALEAAEALLARDPDSHLGHGLRVAVFERSGREEGAVEALRAALAATPDSVSHMTALGARILRDGDPAEAEALLEAAATLDPCATRARLLLARLYEMASRYEEQLALLEAAPSDCRDHVRVRNALAFLLATVPDPSLRDGGRALEIAERVVAESGDQNPGYVDTLAAAHAELGDFERAVAAQERAIAMLEGRTLPEGVRDHFERHLAVYREGRPVRLRVDR